MNDELFLLDLYGRLPYNPKVMYLDKVYTLKLISNEGNLLEKNVYLYKEDGKLLSENIKIHNIKPLLYPVDKVLEINLIEVILGICDYDGYGGLYTTCDHLKEGKVKVYTWGIYLGTLDLHTMMLSTEKQGNFQLRSDMWANIQRLFYKYHIDYLDLIKDDRALNYDSISSK